MYRKHATASSSCQRSLEKRARVPTQHTTMKTSSDVDRASCHPSSPHAACSSHAIKTRSKRTLAASCRCLFLLRRIPRGRRQRQRRRRVRRDCSAAQRRCCSGRSPSAPRPPTPSPTRCVSPAAAARRARHGGRRARRASRAARPPAAGATTTLRRQVKGCCRRRPATPRVVRFRRLPRSRTCLRSLSSVRRRIVSPRSLARPWTCPALRGRLARTPPIWETRSLVGRCGCTARRRSSEAPP